MTTCAAADDHGLISHTCYICNVNAANDKVIFGFISLLYETYVHGTFSVVHNFSVLCLSIMHICLFDYCQGVKGIARLWLLEN